MVLVFIGGFAVVRSLNSQSTADFAASYTTEADTTQAYTIEAGEISRASSYEELYQSLLDNAFANNNQNLFLFETDDIPSFSSDMVPSEQSDGAASASAAPAPMEYVDNTDYSQTNVQVEGVDEADVVKTDGRNIYTLSENEIFIARANGAQTEALGSIPLYLGMVRDFYVVGDRLAVLSSEWGYSYYASNSTSYVSLFDIGDPTAPVHLGSFGQDGWLETTRLVEGLLYMVSVHSINQDFIILDDPQTFVPTIYGGLDGGLENSDEDHSGAAEALAIDAIHVMPNYDSAEYTVLTVIDVERARRTSTISLLGNAETVYMNQDNLYVAATVFEYREGGGSVQPAPVFETRRPPIFPWEVLIFLIDPYDWYYTPYQGSAIYDYGYTEPMTRITRIALNAGRPEVAATTQVSGWLLNQFSLDEHRGYLRVAMTATKHISGMSEGEIQGDDVPIDWSGTTSVNRLLVLNDRLEIVGSIEDLAPGERIYSARFMGDVGYMVTFGRPTRSSRLTCRIPGTPVSWMP